RETFEVLPAILVVGGSFSLTQHLWSNFVDSNLVDIAAGVVSLLATVAFLRVWKPGRVWRFEEDRIGAVVRGGSTGLDEPHSTGRILRAWLPFCLLSLTVLAWGLPSVKGAMNRATTPVWSVPLLDGSVSRAVPVVAQPTPEPA